MSYYVCHCPDDEEQGKPSWHVLIVGRFFSVCIKSFSSKADAYEFEAWIRGYDIQEAKGIEQWIFELRSMSVELEDRICKAIERIEEQWIAFKNSPKAE